MTQQKRLGLVLAINLVMITGLVIVGLVSHSLGVLAAGGDYAADSAGLGLGIIAIQIAKHPHGHPKATTYVALVNATVLLVVTGIVMYEGIRRLTNRTPHIAGLSVMVVSAIATLFMVIGALILGRDAGSEDLHMRSVMLDTISDGISSAALAVGGGIIYFSGKYYWLDSGLAIAIGLLIGIGALRLLKDVVRALRTNSALSTQD